MVQEHPFFGHGSHDTNWCRDQPCSSTAGSRAPSSGGEGQRARRHRRGDERCARRGQVRAARRGVRTLVTAACPRPRPADRARDSCVFARPARQPRGHPAARAGRRWSRRCARRGRRVGRRRGGRPGRLECRPPCTQPCALRDRLRQPRRRRRCPRPRLSGAAGPSMRPKGRSWRRKTPTGSRLAALLRRPVLRAYRPAPAP